MDLFLSIEDIVSFSSTEMMLFLPLVKGDDNIISVKRASGFRQTPTKSN